MEANKGTNSGQLETVKCVFCNSDETVVVYDFRLMKIVSCKDCGLVYTNPRNRLSAVQGRLYEKDYWTAYQKYYERNLPAVQNFCRTWLNELAKYMGKKEWRICELGPGLGTFLTEARKLGHHVEGIEFSEFATHYAGTKLGIETIHFGTVDVLDRLGTFDVFVMFAVIEHLHQPLEALVKINHHISDGGLLLLSTGVYGSFNQRVAGEAWQIIAPQGHLFYFSKTTIRRILEKAGFSVTRLETNSALVNVLTKNRLLVRFFNNWITRLLQIPLLTRKMKLGDEMFIIAKKTRHV